jgi:hypothetical protein
MKPFPEVHKPRLAKMTESEASENRIQGIKNSNCAERHGCV